VASKVRPFENRQRLAAATARYFDLLEPLAAIEENAIARDMASAAGAIDFGKEP
jgi:hypothetical protein